MKMGGIMKPKERKDKKQELALHNFILHIKFICKIQNMHHIRDTSE